MLTAKEEEPQKPLVKMCAFVNRRCSIECMAAETKTDFAFLLNNEKAQVSTMISCKIIDSLYNIARLP